MSVLKSFTLQERFGNMTRVYYKEAVGAFVVFDASRSDSFRAVDKWKSDLDTKVLLPDGRPIPCVLLGNKCDQAPAEAMFQDTDAMQSFCKDKGFAGYFFTSAKENINVEEAAACLLQKIIDNDKWRSSILTNAGDDRTDAINLVAYQNMSLQNEKGKCNC